MSTFHNLLTYFQQQTTGGMVNNMPLTVVQDIYCMCLFPLSPLQGRPRKKHCCKWFIMPPVDSEMGGLVSISSQIAATLPPSTKQ